MYQCLEGGREGGGRGEEDRRSDVRIVACREGELSISVLATNYQRFGKIKLGASLIGSTLYTWRE